MKTTLIPLAPYNPICCAVAMPWDDGELTAIPVIGGVFFEYNIWFSCN